MAVGLLTLDSLAVDTGRALGGSVTLTARGGVDDSTEERRGPNMVIPHRLSLMP